MSLKGVLKNVTGGIGDLLNPLNPFKKPDSLGDPTPIQDPGETLEQEAEDAAIAGDIATRNARMRSSTLGAGSRFIKQQQKAKPAVEAPKALIPHNRYQKTTNTNRLQPGAGTSALRVN